MAQGTYETSPAGSSDSNVGHSTPTVSPPQTAAADNPAADFALRFDHKGCHFESLDTFRGTYSHVGAHPRVPFTLERLLLTIFQILENHPDVLRPAEEMAARPGPRQFGETPVDSAGVP